ncbi:MAG TPA: glycosyltransferase [Thermoanaerobaculia bacterium]|nr:glycosyltransferase [Thermoanaerobaculia bacterium]
MSEPSLAGLRVALVHDWLTGMRGGEKVLESIAALFPGAPIFTLLHVRGSVSAALEAHPIETSFLERIPGIGRRYRSFLPFFPAAIEDFDLGGFDLVVSSSHCVAKGVIPPPGALHVCYCHTPMRYAWDQEHVYFPRRRGLVARLRSLALSRLRTWDAASAPRVDHFLANSSFVAERIRRYYGREAVVLAPPVDTAFFTPREGAELSHCLAVAALAPYKRLEVAIEACRRLGLPLKVVGTGPDFARLDRLAGNGIELLGRVSPDQLRSLYRSAICLVQPGIEDFGIAPVEALACGTPVVAFGRGGVLDQVEDGRHGVLYGPVDDASALAEAIDKCRRIRFNSGEIRQRAETFAAESFGPRFRLHLERFVSLGGTSR